MGLPAKSCPDRLGSRCYNCRAGGPFTVLDLSAEQRELGRAQDEAKLTFGRSTDLAEAL
jgi:hypothetical protein